MIAPHPFGRIITIPDLITHFSKLTSWEERYRQIILLARELPTLPDELKQQQIEISGCENRVWLAGEQLEDGTLHFYGDSDGRIIKGLLAILLCNIEGKTPQQLQQYDPLSLLQQLQLLNRLSATRTNGLTALAKKVQDIATSYQ